MKSIQIKKDKLIIKFIAQAKKPLAKKSSLSKNLSYK